MRLADLPPPDRFQPADVADAAMRSACAANPDVAACEVIGQSEAGRDILGVTLGYGPAVVTLVAGAHADEPVGPKALRSLVTEALAHRDWGADDGGMADLFARATLRIVPHVNPDAEARNRPWIDAWRDDDVAASLAAFLVHRQREPPGRDVEFGYPVAPGAPPMRPENRAATAFLFDGAPVAAHASLHGMAASEGALVLVERRWMDTPAGRALADAFLDAAARAGLPPHDHDRSADPGGDKGFAYGGPGLWSTPTGDAMRAYFHALGDEDTARAFHASSMETAVARGTGADGRTPLCVVPELPLFRVTRAPVTTSRPGVAARAAAFAQSLPALAARARAGADLTPDVDAFGLRATPVADAVRLHGHLLDLTLRAAGVLPP